jgi:hypothetical protein
LRFFAQTSTGLIAVVLTVFVALYFGPKKMLET